MITSVLQKLTLIEQSPTRLVLRELPLFDYFLAAGLGLMAFNFGLFQLWISAIVAVGLGLFVLLQAKMRLIIFDIPQFEMQIVFQSLVQRKSIYQRNLGEISRAYLHQADDGASQIILVLATGEEMGLSVYSRDVREWKEALVIAINAFLHEAKK